MLLRLDFYIYSVVSLYKFQRIKMFRLRVLSFLFLEFLLLDIHCIFLHFASCYNIWDASIHYILVQAFRQAYYPSPILSQGPVLGIRQLVLADV